LQKIVGHQIKEVLYKVELTKTQSPKTEAPVTLAASRPLDSKTATVRDEAPNKFGLNPKYTFSNFIVGKNNELAHAAAQAVAKNPGKSTYNPLFVYGGVGLGKTHLLQAVGHAVLETDPTKKILYTTSEKFTNDYVQAIRNRTTEKFKQTYRSPDLLLIDDVQFMAAKEGTQQEFFHTFNELHQSDKQIVMTSDRPPKAIPALEQRLVSRFEWGMIADISQPDYETRIAILKAKCQEKDLVLEQNIVNHIASVIQNNIRELEGALNKIIAYQQFQHVSLTLDLVKNLLSSHIASGRRSASPKQLINTVTEFYDLKLEEILGQSREKRLAFPRQIIMYLMREELESSYPAIGQEIGGRDHTTAMHAYDKISREIETSARLKQDIEQIKQRLYNG
jgi:chromosomal replication initiator protein